VNGGDTLNLYLGQTFYGVFMEVKTRIKEICMEIRELLTTIESHLGDPPDVTADQKPDVTADQKPDVTADQKPDVTADQKMDMNDEDPLVAVCNHCLRAGCWQGTMRCEKHMTARSMLLPMSILRNFAYENELFWEKSRINKRNL